MRKTILAAAVSVAILQSQREENKMPAPTMTPADKARIALQQLTECWQEASDERNRMLSLLIVLVQKAGGEVVITHGELETVTEALTLQMTPPTEIGFTVKTIATPKGN